MVNPLSSLLGWLLAVALFGAVLPAAEFPLDEIDGAPETTMRAAKKLAEDAEVALKTLKAAAVEGDSYASHVVGYCEEHGIGISVSPKSAKAYYRVAAESGLAAGMRRYGALLRQRTRVGLPDYAAAREWLGKADAKNDKAATLELARMDYLGEGIEKPDLEKAQFLMRMAAEAGLVEAMLELGRGMKQGIFGGDSDAAQAKTWFERAAQKGEPLASLELGFLYEEGKGVKADADRALFHYRAAAQAELPQALYQLGMCALKGFGGDIDEKAAVEWFEKAAARKSQRAMFQLARLYEADVKGVARDYAKSNDWYQKAADHGSLRAQNQLGIKYRDGRGVSENPDLALKWFSSAASQMFPPAMVNLGQMYEDGYKQTVKKEPGIAARLYTEAAKQNDPVGQYLLARLFDRGEGISKDPVAAYVLASASARLGHQPAKSLSQALKKKLTPAQLKVAETRMRGRGLKE